MSCWQNMQFPSASQRILKAIRHEKILQKLRISPKTAKMKSTKIHHFTLKFTSLVSRIWLWCLHRKVWEFCSYESIVGSIVVHSQAPTCLWVFPNLYGCCCFSNIQFICRKKHEKRGIPECFEMGWSSEILQRETTSPCGNHRTLSPITSYAAMCDSVLLVRIISTNLGIEI